MAMIAGGDTLDITWSNPALGTGVFWGVAGEAGMYDLGGFRSDDSGMVDGAGRFINQQNRKAWSFEQIVSNDMGTNMEFEAAVAIAGSQTDTVFTVSNVNGATYQGAGTLVGDLKLDGNKSQFTLKLMGGGSLIKQ